ncbi:MAG: hypothetical protein ACRD3Q_12505, partial [Terriglobales bacterium]
SWRTNTPNRDWGNMLIGTPTGDTDEERGLEYARLWADALGIGQRRHTSGFEQHSGMFEYVTVIITAAIKQPPNDCVEYCCQTTR